MNKHFERDIEHITRLLETQLGRVRHNARVVLLSGGPQEDDGFIPDKELDQWEVLLEEECLKISALHQPVAHDLRFLTVVIKSNRDLERIGDLLESIREFRLNHETIHRDLGENGYLLPLFAKVEIAVSDACGCLSKQDEELARKLWGDNKTIDRLCDQMIEKMRTVLMSKLGTRDLLDALLAVRHAKRIADHAANIAKEVIYLATGEIVRHRRKEILGED